MLIKQRFIGLLVSIVNASNHANCIFSNNKQCMTQSTLINVNPNGYHQGLRCCPFAINLHKFIPSFNALIDLSSRLCFPNFTKDLSLIVLIWLQE